MPKKSHRVASRQAAVSKERKRKKRAQAAQRHPTPAGPPAPAAPLTVATPEPPTAPAVTRPAPAARQAGPRYQYVIADLRKTALLAGTMLIILIVLALVLG